MGEDGSMAYEVDERITHGTGAHDNDPLEDPEDHMGEEIPDPWDDPRQEDWATSTADLNEARELVGEVGGWPGS